MRDRRRRSLRRRCQMRRMIVRSFASGFLHVVGVGDASRQPLCRHRCCWAQGLCASGGRCHQVLDLRRIVDRREREDRSRPLSHQGVLRRTAMFGGPCSVTVSFRSHSTYLRVS